MVKISRLKLENFRSFHSLDFEMRDLNILIGRNGSGKSNLMSYFQLMQEGARGNLANYINMFGGLKELKWKGSTTFEDMLLSMVYEAPEVSVFYDLTLATSGNKYIISSEQILRNSTTLYDSKQAKDNLYNEFTKQRDTVELSVDTELVISQIRNRKHYPTFNGLAQNLSNWVLFRDFNDSVIQQLHNSQSLDIVDPSNLKMDGSNLLSVLYTLANEGQYINDYEILEQTLRDAFPEFKQFIFPLVASGRAELKWVNKDGWEFTARTTSDGMLRFLVLATLLLLPEPPPLIVIDEPEIGLHPRLLPRLAELLKDASQRTQIVVATHSPQLLNAEPIQAEDVVVVDLEDGETRFKRLNSDDLKLWLDRFTLGSLWTMGRLEAQP